MKTSRGSILAGISALMVLGLLLLSPTAARSSVTGDNPCPSSGSNSLPWMGATVGADFAIPSLRHRADPARQPASYPLTVLRPADAVAFPGPRPVVVFQHGLGGNRCALWWAAQYLAGHGYVTTVHRSLPGDAESTAEAYRSGVDAVRSVIDYLGGLRATEPVLGPMIDLERLGLSGHSMGSVIASQLQGDPGLGVKAIVAFDTLRRYVQGDPGAAKMECQGEPVQATQVAPTVPALSFAMDEPCESKPDFKPADLKLAGPRWWSEHAIPNMQLVMKGYPHGGFTDGAGADKKHDLAYWILPWFERWLNGDESQDSTLLAGTVNGRSTSELLSERFLSSACMPGLVDSEDYLSWLSNPVSSTWRCGAPEPASAPVYGNRQLVKQIRLKAVRKKIRAGRKVDLKLRVTVKGLGQPVRDLNLVVRSSNARVKVGGTRRIDRIDPTRTREVPLPVRAKRDARGKVRVKVTVAGRSAGITLRITR